TPSGAVRLLPEPAAPGRPLLRPGATGERAGARPAAPDPVVLRLLAPARDRGAEPCARRRDRLLPGRSPPAPLPLRRHGPLPRRHPGLGRADRSMTGSIPLLLLANALLLLAGLGLLPLLGSARTVRELAVRSGLAYLCGLAAGGILSATLALVGVATGW